MSGSTVSPGRFRSMRRGRSIPLYVLLSYGRHLPILALLLALSQRLCLRAVSRCRSRKAAWTVMIYEDADNSLETPQLANVKEMLQVGSSAQVQVVMLCDRSPKSEPKDQYSNEALGGLPDWARRQTAPCRKGRLTS